MPARFVWLLALAGASSACMTPPSKAPGTSMLAPPKDAPVTILRGGEPPEGVALGPVVVDGEGDADKLLPLFVRRVAELGGNTAVIDSVCTHFKALTYDHVRPGTCGTRNAVSICAPIHFHEKTTLVVMQGRAFSVSEP